MSGRRILVVSSNSRLGRRVADALTAAECSVRLATGEASASVSLLASRFDAVVIDRGLPANGAAILLQRLPFLEPDTEVVAISDRGGLALEAWAAGSTGRSSETASLLASVCSAMAI